MSGITRRTFIKGVGTAVVLAPGIRLRAAQADARTQFIEEARGKGHGTV